MRYIFIIAAFLLSGTTAAAGNSTPPTSDAETLLFATDKPVFTSYRGVKLGMTSDEVREKLGRSKDQSDGEDSFEPADNETARIFYDEEKRVRAISIMYSGDLSKAPSPKEVVGSTIPAREDGGMFKRVEYPDDGFWVSYVKLAGDSPMVMITMQVF